MISTRHRQETLPRIRSRINVETIGRRSVVCLEIDINDEKKLVMIWLTNHDKNNIRLRQRLSPLYRIYKAKKYTVAVFESGREDLYTTTRDLLIYNRRRSAENEVARARKMTDPGH